MPTKAEAFYLRVRQLERSIPDPELFGLAMIELEANDPAALPVRITAIARRLLVEQLPLVRVVESLIAEPLVVRDVETG